MRLFIAEKPSLGRAIANALPKPLVKREGFIVAANGDTVSWCVGHLLEQVEPEVYDPAYKKWSHEHLPIVPDIWKLAAKRKTSKQLSVLRKLVKQADQLVHAGDPDREGQLLVDEVINYCGVSKSMRANVLRCLISDLNPAAVNESLNNLRKNTDFIPLATSALARARADWLYGINMTRLCTLQGQRVGYNGVLSVGRVQTPVLGLVVHRDNEIKSFVSKPFYELICHFKTTMNSSYSAKWKPSSEYEQYMDESNRILSNELVKKIRDKIQGSNGAIIDVKQSKKSTPPPLPYSLSVLQIDAAKRFGMSAQSVLDTCQQLYERHKLITYPRSDCRYLPKDHLSQAPQVIQAIKATCGKLEGALEKADLSLQSKAWNDSKVSAHHAIVPTTKSLDQSRLSLSESKVYELIARQYLSQFYPSFVYLDKQIDTRVMNELFIAKQKEVVSKGWKVLFPSKPNPKNDEKFSNISLPQVKNGEQVQAQKADINEKNTTPPKHFTDATLLSAMTGIARHVTDSSIKRVLRETDGLGTEATRAGIIELLFKRQFLRRKGKDILATEVGLQFIDSLPIRMTSPDMTAHWESQLESISQKELRYLDFMNPITLNLSGLVHELKGVSFTGLRGMGKPAFKFKKKRKRKTKNVA